MSYQEKRSLLTIIVGFFILVSYSIYAYTNYQNGSILADDLPAWATRILIFIGIGIGLTIITQILFHIIYSIVIAIHEKSLNPEMSDKDIEKIVKQTMITDEMDKLVELKSLRVGFAIAGIGFMLSLLFILLGYAPMIMMQTIFISFSFGSICEGLMQIFYYRRGIRHD
jgi:ABC-type bacteriocin/lantibiotic exporter with double-glycine peptidase domain